MTNSERKEAALDLAQMAMNMARDFGLPPIPNIFEVFYTYCDGSNFKLASDLDELKHNGAVTEQGILALFEDHLNYRTDPFALNSVEERLSVEIGKVSLNLHDGVESAQSHTGKLKESIRDLSGQTSKEDLKNIARKLVQSNHSALAVAATMKEKLERSRTQIEGMRSELRLLQENAMTDHLTGVLNRRAFDDIMTRELDKDSEDALSLVILDIDHFKSVNDTWGHNTGDNVLRRLGQVLKEAIKGRDKAARLGGEEFALILPATNAEGAVAVSERIRNEFGQIEFVHSESGKPMGQITLSAGVASVAPSDTLETLYERADQQLYQAKSKGRNRVCLAA